MFCVLCLILNRKSTQQLKYSMDRGLSIYTQKSTADSDDFENLQKFTHFTKIQKSTTDGKLAS